MTTEEKLKEMLGDYYEMGVPGSPNAAILQNMLGADNELRDPQSENEALLKLIYEDVIGAVYDARDEAQAAAEAAGTAAEAVANKAPAITDTASGAVASFPDGADNMPLKSLVIDIDPVQDLHGYDNPWPAGGGVNKLPPIAGTVTERNGIKVTSNGDGTYVIDGTATAEFIEDYQLPSTFSIASGMYLHLCNTQTASGMSFNLRDENNTNITGGGPTALYKSVDLSAHAGKVAKYIRIYVENGTALSNITLKPMVVYSSEQQTIFSPYSNVCPITGWDAVTVYGTGVNLFNKSKAVHGQLDASGERVELSNDNYLSDYINVKPNTSYYALNVAPLTQARPIAEYDINKTFIKITSLSTASSTQGEFTVTANTHYIRVGMYGDTRDTTAVNYPATDTSYHAYDGTAYPLTLPSTVYGGTLTYEGDGVWTVNSRPYYASYAGQTLVGPWVSSMDAYTPGGTPTTGAQVVDLGGTVTEYTVTTSELLTLLGQNNIFADCGDISVTYRADTKLYIKRLTGPTDDDMTADANIAAGTYFMVGNNLFLSTASIAAGETIVPGTNCTATNLAAALNALQ